jgi:hypothetical protein
MNARHFGVVKATGQKVWRRGELQWPGIPAEFYGKSTSWFKSY